MGLTGHESYAEFALIIDNLGVNGYLLRFPSVQFPLLDIGGGGAYKNAPLRISDQVCL